MERLAAAADRSLVSLVLRAQPYAANGMGIERLTRFYEEHGFEAISDHYMLRG